MAVVRLTQIDGKLPNLALMQIARHHRDRGDDVHFTRSVHRSLLEPEEYAAVYGSAIFDFSASRVEQLRAGWPAAIIGGTWDQAQRKAAREPHLTVEDALGIAEGTPYDYSIYPAFDGSIGYTARGCRFKCGFCCVPWKEGPPRPVATIADIWRGTGYPKHLHLLDNDFFGQPREAWEARIDEIRTGGFKACFNQGINVRMIDKVTAAALASAGYWDDQFKRQRLYTAWDNVGDEEVFFRGIDTLEDAGIPPTRVLAYMLVGYDRRETWARVMYRLEKMKARGIRPYPMIFGDRQRGLPLGGYNGDISRRRLAEFQRWVNGKFYNFVSFEHYDAGARGPMPEPGTLFN